MKRFLALALCGSALICGLAQAENYDVVILNGRVMDPETNFDAVRNVGIKDGRIVTITEDAISGYKTIDAFGHVVAPDFIDPAHPGDGFDTFFNDREYLTHFEIGWNSTRETALLNNVHRSLLSEFERDRNEG